jgi:peptidyl-prolyl cis-trans isomerase B (cyclophilin B)
MQRFYFLIILTSLLLWGCGNQGEKAESDQKMSDKQVSRESSSDRPLAEMAPGDRENYYNNLPEMIIDPNKNYVASIRTEKGNIVLELDAKAAPLHVNNFVFLARQGFYDGLTFHRVVPKFVIQGGDPSGNGTGGPGYRIPAEIGLPHAQGAVAMARQPDAVNPERQSSGSQFYITLEATPHLDGAYSVFGYVSEGFDVVQKIQKGDVIKRVDIEEK